MHEFFDLRSQVVIFPLTTLPKSGYLRPLPFPVFSVQMDFVKITFGNDNNLFLDPLVIFFNSSGE